MFLEARWNRLFIVLLKEQNGDRILFQIKTDKPKKNQLWMKTNVFYNNSDRIFLLSSGTACFHPPCLKSHDWQNCTLRTRYTQLCYTTNQQEVAKTFERKKYTYMLSHVVEREQMLWDMHPLLDKFYRGNIPSLGTQRSLTVHNRKHMELPLYWHSLKVSVWCVLRTTPLTVGLWVSQGRV